MTRLAVWLLLCCLAGSLQAAEPWRVTVLYWSDTIPGQIAMRAGLQREVRKYNKQAAVAGQRPIQLEEFVAGDGADGVELQISQFYHALNRKPDLIIVQPTDSAALAEPLERANSNRIPVLAYDQFIEGGALAGLVTSNNYQAGYLAGEVVADTFPVGHVIKLVLLEYPLVSSTVMRVDGFLDALEDLQQPYELLRTWQAVEPEAGRKAAKALLRAFPARGSVDVVFSVNDGGGLAFRKVLEKAGRTEIRLASVDGDPEQVKSLEQAGMLLVDSAQLCAVIGEQTAQAALRILRGEPAHLLYQIPVYPVTGKTLEGYNGWYASLPTAFNKPWLSRKPVWSGQIQIMNLKQHD